jgi:hypothetical protein
MIVGIIVHLDEPERRKFERPVELSVKIQPQPPTSLRSATGFADGSVSETVNRPELPSLVAMEPDMPLVLPDLLITAQEKTTFRRHISTSMLESMSQDVAFDTLMALLDEFPEFRETVFRKMIAGKEVQCIPDLYVATGIQRLQKNMHFRSSYEYELLRRENQYGPYMDPALGPQGYRAMSAQVNLIGILFWLVNMINGN